MAFKKVIIIMGVSGCGKTTIGKVLAKELLIPFYDGDDFHPKENIKKMTSGIPLTDSDRFPWLEILANKIIEWSNNDGAVLACSSLKKNYRQILQTNSDLVQFVHLKANKELIINRLKKRTDHYMPVTLIDSQFEALEEPSDAITIDAGLSKNKILEIILTQIM